MFLINWSIVFCVFTAFKVKTYFCFVGICKINVLEGCVGFQGLGGRRPRETHGTRYAILQRPDGRDRQIRFRLPSSVCYSLRFSFIIDNFPSCNSSCDCYISSCLSVLLACAPFDERQLPGSLLGDAWVIVSAMKRAVRVQTCEMH